jgi:hypothetical protein
MATGSPGGTSGAGGAPRAGAGGASAGAGKPSLVDTVFGARGAAVRLVTLFEPSRPVSATALAFDPTRPGELWMTLREFPVDAPCTSDVTTGCQALVGRVAVIQNATGDDPSATVKTDDNAWHFMRRPSSIAFGDNGNFATCGEHRTANWDDEAVDYMGPTLWSSDPAIFGVEPPPQKNGTHLDMLHSTPFCMGIAHERDNVYWLFNGQLGSLDRYDFREPHEIGGEDHSDGELRRFAEGELLRAPETPSHLALDKRSGLLYVVDTSNGRILRLDTASGIEDGNVPSNDPLQVHARMTNAVLEELVTAGTLEQPSGITLGGDFLFVTDRAKNQLFAFDLDGKLLRAVDSGLPAGSLSGIAFGPDQRLYLSDLATGNAYRVEPTP